MTASCGTRQKRPRAASCSKLKSDWTTVPFNSLYSETYFSNLEHNERYHIPPYRHIPDHIDLPERTETTAGDNTLPSDPVILQPNHDVQAHRSPSHNLGLFSILPSEICEEILRRLLPRRRLRVYLTSLACRREGLACCLMSLRLSCKEMQTAVLQWWRRVKSVYGFTDDPIFGLINPFTTTWILQANQASWDICGFPGKGCSWRRKRTCTKSDCLKRAINLIARMPLRSRELIQSVKFEFLQNDRRVIAAADPEPNESLLQLLKYLPKTQHLEIFYYQKPDPSTWDEVKDMIFFFQEGIKNEHPYVPVSPNSYIATSTPSPTSICLFDAWPVKIASQELGIRLPPRLLSVWQPAGGGCEVKSANGRVMATTNGQEIDGVFVVEAPALAGQYP